MMQRIQTVYLLISGLLIGLLFLFPFAEMAKDGTVYLFNFHGIVQNGIIKESGVSISVLLAIVIVMQGFAILSFKNRARQIRLTVFSVLLKIGLLGMFYFFTYYSFSEAQIGFKISVLFPVLAIVLDYLAIRGIKKDDALIRSIDRIR